MSHSPTNSKASELFRERLVARYLIATKDLFRPGVDVTDPATRGTINFTPRPSADTALNAFAQLLLLRLNASHALISLIDANHQYVLAEAAKWSAVHRTATLREDDKLWVGSIVLSREKGICSVVLPNSAESASYLGHDQDIDPDVVVIDDLQEDARFCNRRFVADSPQMRWYAGAPIRSSDGTKIGAVCVFDARPRQGLSQEDNLFLCGTARTVMKHLEASRIQAEYQRRDRLIKGLDSFVSGLSELTNQRAEAADGIHATADYATPSVSNFSSVKSLTMWEAALPSGCKLMFSRAANILRSAGGYDGTAFFYVPSTHSSRGTRKHHDRSKSGSAPEARWSTMSLSSPSSSAGEGSSDPMKWKPYREQPSSGDETNLDGICPILGFSVSKAEEIVRGSHRLEFPTFLMRDMQKLLGSRPRGRVYLLDSQGAVLPGDTSSSGSGADTGHFGLGEGDESVPPRHQKQAKGRRTSQIKALLKLEPHARAFICLPLWDYNRQRWFAFSIYWILNPTRDPSADRDLIFLQVFGNSIANALAHLDHREESRAKDSFVSSISHELRSPLHGILGATNFLYDSNMGRFQRQMLDTVTSCGRTLLDSLEHVMDFAKINNFSKTNRRNLSKVTAPKQEQMETLRQKVLAASSLTSVVDMSLVIEEVVESVVLGFTVQHDFMHSEDAISEVGLQMPTFASKPRNMSKSNRTKSTRGRVRLCLDLTTRDSLFETQPGAWRRIIMNLVGNALKYTEEGSINISFRVQDANSDSGDEPVQDSGKVKVGGGLIFTVQDTGIGMSNEFLQSKVFTAFSQEDSLASGTGLGLSIVDQIVTSLGGHVDVTSAKGFGSTLRVNVPLSKRVQRSAESPKADIIDSVIARFKGLRVCILEDVNSRGSLKNTDSALRAEDKFSQVLMRTLAEAFEIETKVASQWIPGTADVVICLEPSFRQLEAVRSPSVGQMPPPMLFIAHDALEVVVLRADSRITGHDSYVEITYQPLGPRKLASALIHCLDQSKPFSPSTSMDSIINPPSQARASRKSQDLSSGLDPRVRANTPTGGPLEEETSQSLKDSPEPKSSSIILCVDDNPLNLRLLTTFLSMKKLSFEQAVNGQDAVNTYMAAPGSFRCILMDISMPIMDGMTATRIIRQHEADSSLPRIPIFALTGLASAAARNEALEAGIDRLFTKPVPFSALSEILSLSQPPAETGQGTGKPQG